MKHLLLLLIMSTTLILSCSKDDDNSSSINPGNVTNTVTSGTWRITYYWDTDHEETSAFSGYSFTFGSNGVLTATKTGSTVTGSWSTGTDDSKTELIIVFASPDSFVEISDDWEVIEMTDTRIKLLDVSGGNGGTDQLIFEKN
jgi:hypothetical protein